MNRPGHDDTDFFLGIEVEHTPGYGMPTLFVVGLQSEQSVNAALEQAQRETQIPIQHLFFGANHSYVPTCDHDCEQWETMITAFLQRDFLCTLDIPLSAVEQFNEGGLNEYHNFIPQIRVSIPYIKLWNYNTMIKLDDRDFAATNPGVWCHSLHQLMQRDCFTSWNRYSSDKVIK